MHRELLVVVLCGAGMLTACSAANGTGDDDSNGSDGSSGGATTSGGVTSAAGGTTTGGTGTTSGGAAGGGATTGGAASGGMASGGVASGGLTGTGGDDATGATGGVLASGGTDTGGAGGASSSGGGNTGSGSTGGGSASDDVPTTSACSEYSDWDETWRARETDILQLTNEARLAGTDCNDPQNPVEPLVMDPVLRCAARLHALDMAERGYFSHGTWDDGRPECTASNQCSQGQTCSARLSGSSPARCLDGPSVRLSAVGYTGRGWGENIAAGNSGASGTMNQWLGSNGHCTNIMSSGFSKIGVGYAAGGPYGHVWVQVFGN